MQQGCENNLKPAVREMCRGRGDRAVPIEDQQQSRGELTSSHLNPNQEQRNGEERSNREKQSAGTTLAEGFCPLSLSALSPFQTPPCYATFPEILQPRGSQLSQCLLTFPAKTHSPSVPTPTLLFLALFTAPRALRWFPDCTMKTISGAMGDARCCAHTAPQSWWEPPLRSSASTAPGSAEMRAELASLCSISQEERFLTPGQH